MSHTYTNILIADTIFSTKDRQPFITPEIGASLLPIRAARSTR